MNSILDLRPAVALLELQKQGLASVLEEVLHIEPARGKKRFQQYNWTTRPVDSEALAYAIDDVVHLYNLRDELFVRIREAGLMDRYLVENFAVQNSVPETDRKPGMLRGNRVRNLKPQQKKLLEELHGAREEVARRVNLPPNSVYSNKDIFAVVAGERLPADAYRSRNMPSADFADLVRLFEQLVGNAK